MHIHFQNNNNNNNIYVLHRLTVCVLCACIIIILAHGESDCTECPERKVGAMYIYMYIYIHIGELDSLVNYYYKHSLCKCQNHFIYNNKIR